MSARSGRRFNKRRRKARERARRTVLDEAMPFFGHLLLDVIGDWTARGIIEPR